MSKMRRRNGKGREVILFKRDDEEGEVSAVSKMVESGVAALEVAPRVVLPRVVLVEAGETEVQV